MITRGEGEGGMRRLDGLFVCSFSVQNVGMHPCARIRINSRALEMPRCQACLLYGVVLYVRTLCAVQ